jgi:hypothetical protein
MKELCLHRIVNTQSGRCQECGMPVTASHHDRIEQLEQLEQRVAELEDLVVAIAIGDRDQSDWERLDNMMDRRRARQRGGA